MACRIEDAGFEIRDMIAWVYGSGFPKSHNLSGDWQGWGTALKPALEPVTVARKPLIGTVAQNVLQHGTGALNIDGGRVAASDTIAMVTGKGTLGGTSDGYDRPWKNDPEAIARREERAAAAIEKANLLGRWPANLIHDGSDEVVGEFPAEKTGSAARFFYCAKASKRDRDDGLQPDVTAKRQGARPGSPDETGKFPDHDHRERTGNIHPTVKPTDLMRYLCRLVTPPGGIVLDPFMGSGSTGKAAMLEGFRFVGIEREAQYVEIAKARILAGQRLRLSQYQDLFA
jgi:site-specific DNA-methyltransferase (adenine-specific)